MNPRLTIFYFLFLLMLILRFDKTLLVSMIDIQECGDFVVEWVAKDPYGFLTTVTLALVPIFIVSALISRKLAKMIEEYRKQKKQQNHQQDITKIIKTD